MQLVQPATKLGISKQRQPIVMHATMLPINLPKIQTMRVMDFQPIVHPAIPRIRAGGHQHLITMPFIH
jgi:hypothetical protein